jgi:hypothetical protein
MVVGKWGSAIKGVGFGVRSGFHESEFQQDLAYITRLFVAD